MTIHQLEWTKGMKVSKSGTGMGSGTGVGVFKGRELIFRYYGMIKLFFLLFLNYFGF